MSERSPYSRVYWTIRDDARLASVYPHDAHLAAALLLGLLFGVPLALGALAVAMGMDPMAGVR